MNWKEAAIVTLRAEGPCANSWAHGNPVASSSDFRVTDKDALPLASGEWYELYTYSDYGPNTGVGVLERQDWPHHFEGFIPVMLLKRSKLTTPVWPPMPEELVLHGVGWLTYNLHRLGVAEEVQFECLTPLVGPPFKLETPLYDWSVPDAQWPWWTAYRAGSTYSFPRMRLMVGID